MTSHPVTWVFDAIWLSQSRTLKPRQRHEVGTMRNTGCAHSFGLAFGIGAGISRRCCMRCGDTEVDLRPASGDTNSFVGRVTRFGVDWTAPALNFATGA